MCVLHGLHGRIYKIKIHITWAISLKLRVITFVHNVLLLTRWGREGDLVNVPTSGESYVGTCPNINTTPICDDITSLKCCLNYPPIKKERNKKKKNNYYF